MTGFGKAEVTTKIGTFAVEVSSVNNRFLDIQVRQPRPFSALEHRIRELVTAHVSRGKVHVFVNYEEPPQSLTRYTINEEAAKAYHRQLKDLSHKLKLPGEVELSHLLQLPEVSEVPFEAPEEEDVWAALGKAVEKATKAMVRMRRREGDALAKDMRARLDNLAGLSKQVVEESVKMVTRYRQKLSDRLEELLNGRSIDKVRLEEEVALMAERTDITEDCTRLSSHIDQYRRTLRKNEPVGKKLNFILQELNREANTIASKATEIDISRAAIAIKEEVEKLREQIQNVE
jgi:uncharacterized protein (TIGR00255 family)